MELKLVRKYKKEKHTIGKLYVDGTYFCDVLEDKDRGLKQTDAYASNKRKKVYGETAIPTGRYQVLLGVYSPKFASKSAYDFCDRKPPLIANVPCFEGIRIHAGNTAKDSYGCLLVGKNREVGKVLDSLVTLKALYAKLKAAEGMIFITIE